MEIVGLSGFAGAGKDTAAEALAEEGFERIAFADVLRDIAYAIDPYVDLGREVPVVDDDEINLSMRRYVRLQKVIDDSGWDWSKNNIDDVRRLLQRLGTEAGREILGENIWVDTAFRNAKTDKIAVTDVRFPNEAKAVREKGGVLVRIHRPGVGPRNDHASELALVEYPFDYHLDNDGSIEEFKQTVKDALC